MHELYIAEKLIKEVEKIAEGSKSEKVLEVNVAIPEDEHFTEKEFTDILKVQSEGTSINDAKFNVVTEKTNKVYVKDIKVL